MCLLLGDARLAFENYEEPSVAGVFELGVADCDVILNCRGQRRLEVRRLLQRGEDRVVNLVADGVAEEAGTEEFAERAAGLNLSYLGD